jgi:hypothetical protein
MDRGMKVHRSVRTRILACNSGAGGAGYLPKIRCVIDGEARHLTKEEWVKEEPGFFEWVD